MKKIKQTSFQRALDVEIEVSSFDDELHGLKRLTYNPFHREFTLTFGKLIKHFVGPNDACEAYNTL